MVLEEEEEAAMAAAAITVEAMAAEAMVAEAMAVVITVEAMVAEAMAVVITVVDMVAEAMAVVILHLITLTPINLPEQKVGKTEVMATLLKIQNMKVGGAGEKGAFLMRVKPQTRKINNPFLAVLSSF